MSEYRSIQGELKILQSNSDFIFPVELWLLNDKVNRNNWQFINLEQHRTKWTGKPILVAYVNGGRTAGDGHNQRTKVDRNGEEYQSFTDATAERICGALSEKEDDIRLEDRDGALWTVGRGFLWAWYSHEICLQIADDARQGRTMSVSIEALVTKSRMEDGVEVEESYEPLGVTILGHGVAPAVKDAHIAMLESIGSELKELKLRAASYLERDEQNQQKPHKDSTKKELKKSMRFSKAQLKELQEKVGGEYKVLSAEQEGSDIRVRLMRKSDRTFYAYDMTDSDETVLTERFVARAAYIGMEAAEDGEESYCAEAGDVIAEECAEAEAERDRACSERDALATELAECRAQLAAMREFESKRRVSAAKEHAKATLNSYNANRTEKVSETVIASIVADAEAGVYSDRMDKDGNWIGLSAVEKDVKALCADEQMKLDAKRAQSERTQFVWNRFASVNEQPDDGSPAALLASL